jgi:hypothetical protein
MQLRSTDGTRMERTGWRDEEISRRHRTWGFNCPAVDLDFLMVEYNCGKPCGLVEYKHYHAQKPNLNHATYRALSELASMGSLPFLLAYYWPETWSFSVFPVNIVAKQHYAEWQAMTERQYVQSLYRIRRLKLDETISHRLNDVMPPSRT